MYLVHLCGSEEDSGRIDGRVRDWSILPAGRAAAGSGEGGRSSGGGDVVAGAIGADAGVDGHHAGGGHAAAVDLQPGAGPRRDRRPAAGRRLPGVWRAGGGGAGGAVVDVQGPDGEAAAGSGAAGAGSAASGVQGPWHQGVTAAAAAAAGSHPVIIENSTIMS